MFMATYLPAETWFKQVAGTWDTTAGHQDFFVHVSLKFDTI